MSADLVLGPMLRHVGEHHATIWVETSDDCVVEVCLAQLDRAYSTRTFRVGFHCYALVIVDDLPSRATVTYEVRLDGEQAWPRNDGFPPPVIRTLGTDGQTRILAGSCRSAAPHEPPWTAEPSADRRGIGVDALRAHGLRMLTQPPSQWPDLLILTGDQVYADDAPPVTRQRLASKRCRARSRARSGDGAEPPEEIVRGFEEYTWLYHEAWSADVERWVFSTVPTAMIFDDHDMIDDWNISQSWVSDARDLPWWTDHVVSGLVSYWVYQHLGNLSPEEIAKEGLLERALLTPDAEAELRQWAMESEHFTPVPGGYRFSYARDLGPVRVVVADCRNGRVLTPKHRAMLDDAEFDWIARQMCQPCRHLILVTSLPLFVVGGLHGLQAWNEAIADGRWGRAAAWASEHLRRELDLEDWAAFHRSFVRMVEILRDVASERHDAPPAGPPASIPAPPASIPAPPASIPAPPASITVLSGDIHFSYCAKVDLDDTSLSRVHQVVSSPIRNSLSRRDARVLRFAVSNAGRRIGRFLQRLGGVPDAACRWQIIDGPFFHNGMAQLDFSGEEAVLTMEHAAPDGDGTPVLSIVVSKSL
ncbi:MAG: alkaline phosphatase family protein [Acidimicrobiia bacterium]